MSAVKPLDWAKHPTADLWRADTLIGSYIISAVVSPATWSFRGIEEADGATKDADSAMAAAQRDYEQQVLSLLAHPAPSPSGYDPATVERLVEALTTIDGEAPSKEPRDEPTTTDYEEAFLEGAVRGRWEMANIARPALPASRQEQSYSGSVICPECLGERRVKGHLCPRCGGGAQIRRADLKPGEAAPFEPRTALALDEKAGRS